MEGSKKESSDVKERLHLRNKHRQKYDFEVLIKTRPALQKYIQSNINGDATINFANPSAVLALNAALLHHHYDIAHWEIPHGYLCPPVPGRADYIHHAADLLGASHYGVIPVGSSVAVLDVGVGANCIYPIIGVQEYGWSFVGSDIDPIAIASAKHIVVNNPTLKQNVQIRFQNHAKDILKGIIQYDERFDLVISNPPFHASPEDAQKDHLRKLSHLKKKKVIQSALNFGGQHTELCTPGGERQFAQTFIRQSKRYSESCFWFSILISKESNVKHVLESLKLANSEQVIVKPMGQGNKKSRIIAWTFLGKKEQQLWITSRWNQQEKPETL